MWDWIVNILFELLKLIQTFAVDWGLSIIILVVIIRLLLTPFMLKSTKSTARMQVLQPKMLEIQERLCRRSPASGRGDAEVLQREQVQPDGWLSAAVDSDACPVRPIYAAA